MSQENVEERVRLAVIDALACDPDVVTLDAVLMADLGAESLDFLDLVFKLERDFGIQITRGEIEQAARGDMAEEEFAPDGIISDAGLERLRALMPEATEHIKPGLRPAQILELFTVRTFANIVRGKLERDAQQDPSHP